MTIKQLLNMPVGTRTGGGFVLTIKHTHKPREIKDGWLFEETMTDETGDILADFFVEKYIPLVRGQEIKIIVCEIQSSTTTMGKKLYVEQWERITCTADELPQRYPLQQSVDPLGRSKVKCKLTEAYIKYSGFPCGMERKQIISLADWVMSPEDKYDG